MACGDKSVDSLQFLPMYVKSTLSNDGDLFADVHLLHRALNDEAANPRTSRLDSRASNCSEPRYSLAYVRDSPADPTSSASSGVSLALGLVPPPSPRTGGTFEPPPGLSAQSAAPSCSTEASRHAAPIYPPGVFLPPRAAFLPPFVLCSSAFDLCSLGLPPLPHMTCASMAVQEGVILRVDKELQGHWAEWTVRADRLTKMDKSAVSQEFKLDLPGHGPTGFKMLLIPMVKGEKKGDGSFKRARGKGHVVLKCVEELEEWTRAVLCFSVGIGDTRRLPRLSHDFAQHFHCGIETEKPLDFAAAADNKDSFVVRLFVASDAPDQTVSLP
mmetsp:Transcript_129618/g.414631  ORF Transcript_129618/g.414631 Transcript_129618/m.414631 type:complete len:328 (+) Transcript_129618:90-1073(+)